MKRAFERELGMGPREYRHLHQSREPGSADARRPRRRVAPRT
jgi:hypothetical protein